MGRKNQKLKYMGRWAMITVVNDPKCNAVKYFPLDKDGKLRIPFKTKKHDRTQDYKTYLPNSLSDGRFCSSHPSSPQLQINGMETMKENFSISQIDEMPEDSLFNFDDIIEDPFSTVVEASEDSLNSSDETPKDPSPCSTPQQIVSFQHQEILSSQVDELFSSSLETDDSIISYFF